MEAEPFSEGLARVAMEPYKFGFINIKGELVSELKWNNAFFFSDGFAAVKKESRWGFINKKGDLVIEPQWKLVRPFYKGFSIISDSVFSKKARYGIIDKKGKIVSEIQWDSITRQGERTFEVMKNGGQTLIIIR